MPRVVMTIAPDLFPPGAAKHVVAVAKAFLPDAYVRTTSDGITRVSVPSDGSEPAWGVPDGPEPNLPCPINGCDQPCRGEVGFGVHIARHHGLKGRRAGLVALRGELLRLAKLGEKVDMPPIPPLRKREGKPRPQKREPKPVALVEPEPAPEPAPALVAVAVTLGPTRVRPTPQPPAREEPPPVVEEAAVPDPAPEPEEDPAPNPEPPPVTVPPVAVAKKDQWVSVPIERRPFDPDRVRAQGITNSFIDLSS